MLSIAFPSLGLVGNDSRFPSLREINVVARAFEARLPDRETLTFSCVVVMTRMERG